MSVVAVTTTRQWANGRPVVRVVLDHDPDECVACRVKKAYRERQRADAYWEQDASLEGEKDLR